MDLDSLKRKLTNTNNDLREMTSKCQNLQDELMKEKLNNQSAGNLYENIPIALKNENEVGKKTLH